MPGEYNTTLENWTFSSLNGEGYTVETAAGLCGKNKADQFALITGYRGTVTDSRLSLYLQGTSTGKVEKAYGPITLEYSMYVKGGSGMQLALEADTAAGVTELCSFELGNSQMMGLKSAGSDVIELEQDKWYRYSVSLYPDSNVYKLYINGRLEYTGTLTALPERVNSFSFVMKSENDYDCYALDDVYLIYGAYAPGNG